MDFIPETRMKCFFYVFVQVKHHSLFSCLRKNILEIVWGRCKICSQLLAEVRLLSGFKPFELMRIFSFAECDKVLRGKTHTSGLCVVFKDHLKEHNINFRV